MVTWRMTKLWKVANFFFFFFLELVDFKKLPVGHDPDFFFFA